MVIELRPFVAHLNSLRQKCLPSRHIPVRSTGGVLEF